MAEIDLAKHRNGEIGTFLLTSRANTRASSTTPRYLRRGRIAVTRLIRARIDSAALRANLRRFAHRAPRSRVMAVVKANAYGHGLLPTALALTDADAFARRAPGEAIALREAGLKHRIVLLEGVFDAAQLAEARSIDWIW